MDENLKVPFTSENGMKCICSKCPVQTGSDCSKKKMEKMKEMMENPEMAKMMPKPEEVPGLYCSSGIAACKDIDTTQMCICGNCPLWEEYDLPGGKPMGYYCRDGEAK